MSNENKCTFCSQPIELPNYIDHLIHSCDKLSAIEKNRAQEAIDKLLCECRVCNNYVYVNGYENHRIERHPHTKERWHDIEPQLSCFCPFVSGCVMPFNKYKNHSLKECAGYINFIAGHCRPPADWPHAEIDKLKYWIRLLVTSRKSQPITEESEGGNSGPSIWVTFVQGGLCNGR
jgi:hypothetical protein